MPESIPWAPERALEGPKGPEVRVPLRIIEKWSANSKPCTYHVLVAKDGSVFDPHTF